MSDKSSHNDITKKPVWLVKGQLSGCARSIILVRSEGGRLGGVRLRDVHQAPGEPQPLTRRVAGVREGAL